MKRAAVALIATLTGCLGLPAVSAATAPSSQLPAISSLLVLTRIEKANAGINQPSLADSMVQTLQKAQDFAVKGDSSNAAAQITKFETIVSGQRGTHIFAAVADHLLGLATGSIPSDVVTVTPGAAVTVTQTVNGVVTSVSIPAGTKIGIVAVQPPVVPDEVSSPTARLALGGAVVRAYDKYGVPITVPSSPLTLAFSVPGTPDTVAANAEVDTVDPKTHRTQRLSSTVAPAANGAVMVTARTPHLSPFTVTAPLASGIITDFAGGAGEGQATSLGQYEAGLAAYHSTIYVADFDLGVVRAIDATSGRETIAAGTTGTSILGSVAGDGGPATAALLNDPQGVAVDTDGDLFIADTGNSRIRKVDTSGTITTVAGRGDATHYGYSGDGGPATSADLDHPDGVAVDANGDLFIADRLNNAVREVAQPSENIDTVSGLTDTPTGIAADPDGTIYVAEQAPGGSATNIVRRTPAGAVATLLSVPGYDPYTPLALDGTGHLLVGSYSNATVLRVDLTSCSTSCTVTPYAGSGQDGFSGDGHVATTARLSSPMGLAVDSDGAAYIADSGNVRVRRVDYAGIITTFAGDGTARQSGDGGQATNAQLSFPEQVAVDNSANTYVTDYDNHSVRKVDPNGVITTFASKLGDTAGIATDNAGNVYVSEIFDDPSLPSKILKIRPDGAISTLIAGLPDPAGLAIDNNGNVLVADTLGMLYRVTPNGTSTVVAGGGTLTGMSADGGPATNAELDQLADVAVDPSGDIYVSDWAAHLVREILPDGTITTIAGTGASGSTGDGGPAKAATLKNPWGLAVDSAGQLYISDQQSSVVRAVSTDGLIKTVAGTGIYGHSGDGGPAALAQLTSPQGLAIDSAGRLDIVDAGAGCVRTVQV